MAESNVNDSEKAAREASDQDYSANRYYSHTNRHADEYGRPWGWITMSPDWGTPAVACWGAWTGRAAVVVVTAASRAGLDIRAPWSVRESPKRMSWDAPEWHVVNADGAAVLEHIKDQGMAAHFVRMANQEVA